MAVLWGIYWRLLALHLRGSVAPVVARWLLGFWNCMKISGSKRIECWFEVLLTSRWRRPEHCLRKLPFTSNNRPSRVRNWCVGIVEDVWCWDAPPPSNRQPQGSRIHLHAPPLTGHRRQLGTSLIYQNFCQFQGCKFWGNYRCAIDSLVNGKL